MKNELITIGPFTVYGYGLMIAIGILAAYGTMTHAVKKAGQKEEEVFGLVAACAVGGFVGAKVLFLLTVWKDFVADPWMYFMNFSDGFVVYGGIINGILTGYLYCKKRKLNFLRYFDLAMPSIALAQGFGRIGCFLAGCCYGKETQFPIAIVFSQSEFAPNGMRLIPTQLYSAAFDFGLFFLLKRIAEREKKVGTAAAMYLILYSVGRFIIEFFRGDLERGMIGGISTSQFLSIGILAAGLGMLCLVRKTRIGSKLQA